MRVAVANWSSRRVGGIEEYVSLIIPALRQDGLEVAFWHEASEPRDRFLIQPPRDVADFCAAEMGLDASLRALAAWKPDVLYVQGLRDAVAEAELLNIAPAVCFLHTYTGTCISGTKTFTRPTVVPCDRQFGWPCLAEYFPRGCGGSNPLTMVRLFDQQSSRLRLLHRYRSILTHTDHMRREMAKHGLEAQVVPFPVETAPSSMTRVADVSWRLLFAGRLEALKGGSVFLEALPLVSASLARPIHAIFAGDGPERSQLEASARELERTTSSLSVEFTGWLAQPEVATTMRSVDLLVVPSLWPEPFGSVGPAAAQHGVPAAAFSTGGIPQWLVDGVTGHMAPADPPTAAGLARAIVQCLEDPQHYEALKQGATKMAARFTMERHLPELVATLERVSTSLASRAV